MKLFVLPNLLSEHYIDIAKHVVDVLVNKHHYEVSLTKIDSIRAFGSEEFSLFPINEADVVVSIGGDAFLLNAATEAYKYNIPLLGINAGHVGYLCAIKADEIDSLDENKMSSLKLSKRSVIEFAYRNRSHFAFNDVVVGKMNFGKSIRISYQIKENDNEPHVIQGDGLIVSTPTGSTAYNVAAGGIVLDENSDKFVITPICSRTKEKSCLVNNTNIITINPIFSYENKTMIYIDGILLAELYEPITITKAKKELLLLTK